MGKNNKYVKSIKEGTKVESYSIKKFKVGAASVVIGASIFLGAGAVAQASEEVSNNTTTNNTTNSGEKVEATSEAVAQPKVENTKESVASAVAAKVGAETPKVEAPKAEEKQEVPAEGKLDKSGLEAYINEVSANISAGKYANKTEASVVVLTTELENARATLVSAKTQAELNAAYNKLITTVNSKLVNKPVEKKETPEVDTTNGQPTVGKKAENTEKKSDSNSIENTGSNDPRNGKALDKNNAFRAETTETHGNFNYSVEYSNGKEIYLYNEEDADVNITVSSTAGNITKATVKAGSGQFVLKSKSDQAIAYAKKQSSFNPPEEEVEIDGYGWSYHQTLTETQGPVTIKITGKPNDTFKGLKSYTKTEDQRAVLGARYLQLEDSTGARLAGGNNASAPGYFNLVVKSQTYKYDIKDLTDSTRITVNDIDNVTDAELTKIKSRLQLEHSKTSNDARFVGGTAVANPTSVIDTVAVSATEPNKLVVTYKDGSTDTIEKNKVLNVKPKGIIPFSNPTAKEIYVYKGEETNLEFGVTDDSGKVKDLRIVQAKGDIKKTGAAQGIVKNEYGLTMTSQTDTNGINATIANPAITRITGTVSVPKQPNFTGNLMTRYLVAEDLDGAVFSPPLENADLNQEGAFRLVVREQTQKYDVQGQTDPANKIVVDDIDNLSDADFEKIKNNIKIQYNTADDARLADKNGTLVENASNYIKSITKDGDKIVVTYKDGSTDKITLNEVLKINKQPAIDAVNKAAEDKIAKINKTPNATDEEKAAAIAKVNADKEKAVAAINDANVTTKAALDQAKESGTTAIAADNPVVTKKDSAKADVEAERKAKADAITADKNLSQVEKDAAIAKINKAAEDATKAIDAATTDAAVDTAKNTGTTEFGKVNPIAKENAKAAITNALTAKNKEIDDRTDLTQAEKDAAKEEAKKLADAELAKVEAQPDNAETADAAAAAQKIVNDAEDKGVADVTSVYPIAKEQAKQVVAEELTKKEAEIDARTDLTQEEKDAAKKEAQAKAKVATDNINAQPAIADSEDKATAAQQAVDTAKNTGVSEVKAVNPEAAKKSAAKKAIDDALKAKEDAIDARTDLTDAEKKAAKDAAKAEADKAKEAVNNATSNADVETAKGTGTTAVNNVTPVAKEAAKQAISKALEDKNSEIDKRTDLTDEEKTEAKAEAKKLADAQLAEIAKQPDAAATPEAAKTAQDAVDAAKKTGVDEVTAVNPTAEIKPAAKKAIEDKLAKQLEEIANTPDATDEEKAEAAKKAKEAAEKAKEAVDKATTDEVVKTEKGAAVGKDGAKGTIDELPVVEDKPNARKAIDEEAKAKKEAIDARKDLSSKAKEALKAKVDKVAAKAKAAIDAVTSVEDVNTIEEADKAAIKAIGDINRPIDKVLVKDPANLTDEEKAKILEEVKKVNPTAKDVKYNKDGKIEVTAENGDKGTINPAKIVKTEADLDNGKGGNDINKPLDKVIVKDPANLTDEEKAKIVAKVEEVNPDAIVTIDENGTVSVSTPDGKTSAIPASDLVRTKEDTEKAGAGNSNIVKPADKIVGEANDPDDQAKAEEKLRELNPDTKSVKFDEDGNATVTLKDGTTATIPSEDLFRSEADVTKPNAGNDIVKPADKTVAANPEKLTDAEKKAIEDKVKVVNPGATVVVDDKGNATVTTPEGKTAVILGKDLVKTEVDAAKPNAGNDVVKPADKTVAANPEKLTDAEKKAIEDKVKAVNPGATVVVDDKGNATVTTPEGKTAVIPAIDLVKSAEDATKPNAGNDIVKPADKTVAANPEKLTDAEKKAIEDKVKAVNPGATVVVDDKGNATVTTPEGKTAVIPAIDLVKSAEDATKPNAGNDIVKPADKTVAANPEKLTDAEKKAIEDKVKAVNPGATVVVDDKGNATVTTPEGKTAVIPAIDLVKSAEDATKPNAGNDIVKPADKTVVADPAKLTDAEKKAIEDKVKAVNPGATVAVDDKGNATVTTPEGKTAVIPATDLVKTAEDAAKPNAGNNVVKPADKTVAANPEKLTNAEKKAIEDKVKAVNPGATVVVDDKGNATVTTPEGKTAVIPATDLVKTEADAAKPNAGNDVVKPADKTLVKDPAKLTDAEKKAIEDKVKAVNPGATVVVDDKGNATVTTPEGKTAVIPATDLVKSSEDATKPNAGNDIVKPADKTLVKDPAKLTDEEKAAIAAKVKEVNPEATVVIDDKGNATVTTKEGKTAVIPATDLVKSAGDAAKPNAGNDIVKPADKTLVKDPAKLTDEEKAAIAAKVKEVNPGATVVVDDKGNATVTTPEGKTAVIPATDLVKTEADLGKENAGNDINTPTARTAVANKDALTDAEKEAVKKAVEGVNPGATVVVDDKGNATVTTKDGKVAVIPASKLVIPADKVTDAAAQSGINTPAARTLVANKDNLTPEEIAKIKAAVEAVNPGATVVVDAKGNATVTTKDGLTATISAEQLVKDAKDVAAKNNGENINLDFEKQVVADLDNLTDADKAGAKAKILAADPNVAEVIFDAKGNATVILKDGKSYIILAKDIFKKEEEKVSPMINFPERVQVGDLMNLTDEEKETVRQALIKANLELKDAKITVSATGETTIVYPDGRVVVIPAEKLVVAKGSSNNGGNSTNVSRENNVNASNSKLGQRLANTGTTETNTGLAGLGMAILGGLLAAARRKNDKN